MITMGPIRKHTYAPKLARIHEEVVIPLSERMYGTYSQCYYNDLYLQC